jgi:6-pyruvoyl-tetrahydropterin synthase
MDQNKSCNNCGMPVGYEPVTKDGSVFCCFGCAEGGPCTCSYVGPSASPFATPQTIAPADPRPDTPVRSSTPNIPPVIDEPAMETGANGPVPVLPATAMASPEAAIAGPPASEPEPSVNETLSIVRQLLETVERRAREQAAAAEAAKNAAIRVTEQPVEVFQSAAAPGEPALVPPQPVTLLFEPNLAPVLPMAEDGDLIDTSPPIIPSVAGPDITSPVHSSDTVKPFWEPAAQAISNTESVIALPQGTPLEDEVSIFSLEPAPFAIEPAPEVTEQPMAGSESSVAPPARAQVSTEPAVGLPLPVEDLLGGPSAEPAPASMLREPTVRPVASSSQEVLMVVRPISTLRDAEYLVGNIEAQPEVESAVLEVYESGSGVATYRLMAKDRPKLVLGVMRWQQLRARNVRIIPDRIELTLAQPLESAPIPPPAPVELPAPVLVDAGGSGEQEEQPIAAPIPAFEPAQPVFPTLVTAALTADVDVFFNARHFVILEGHQGPVHPHSWRVQARITGEMSQGRTVLMPFAEAKRLLQDAVGRYNNTLLNNMSPFDQIQPTSENIAGTLYHDLAKAFAPLPVRLVEVSVWESPTSRVAYSEVAMSGAMGRS